MHVSTAQRLIEINQRFYADFGESFSATRRRLQPGVQKILSELGGTERILDLGCGNGEMARCLAENGFQGDYTGLDFSLPLLDDARIQAAGFRAVFKAADLTSRDWDQALQANSYSTITAFAVLHHIPSRELRLEILQKARRLLAEGGKFIHSNWQFLNSEKLKGRIQPWDAAGMNSTEVDEGDYLLDWRSGGSGLRYAHHFTEQELNELAAAAGFSVVSSFLSDGAGERLGLYQVWKSNEIHS